MESIQDVAPGDVSDMPNENSYDNNEEMPFHVEEDTVNEESHSELQWKMRVK